MDWKLELVVIPVSDVDRAASFYVEQAGFELLVDHRAGEDFRVVQLEPKGSSCAIALMKSDNPGRASGLHLVVSDIEAARTELVGRGMDVSEPFHFGAGGQVPGLEPSRASHGSFLSFKDPDGNGWLVQEVHRAASADA